MQNMTNLLTIITNAIADIQDREVVKRLGITCEVQLEDFCGGRYIVFNLKALDEATKLERYDVACFMREGHRSDECVNLENIDRSQTSYFVEKMFENFVIELFKKR